MAETFANAASSTLSTSVLIGDLVIPVVSGTSFPSSGQFRIKIGTEIMLCTSRAGANLTVLRAQEGTTAAGYSSGATVTSILTAGALTQFQSDTLGAVAALYKPSLSAAVVVAGEDKVLIQTVEVENAASPGGFASTISREDALPTTDSADHLLTTIDVSGNPDAGFILDVLVMGVGNAGIGMHWFKKSRAWLNVAGVLTAGVVRNVDDELVGGPPPGTWTVSLTDDAAQALQVVVNSNGDSVRWYIISQRVRIVGVA